MNYFILDRFNIFGKHTLSTLISILQKCRLKMAVSSMSGIMC